MKYTMLERPYTIGRGPERNGRPGGAQLMHEADPESLSLAGRPTRTLCGRPLIGSRRFLADLIPEVMCMRCAASAQRRQR